MIVWQIGIKQSSYPYNISWQNDFVKAGTKSGAEDLASTKGYYRNLCVRESPVATYSCLICGTTTTMPHVCPAFYPK